MSPLMKIYDDRASALIAESKARHGQAAVAPYSMGLQLALERRAAAMMQEDWPDAVVWTFWGNAGDRWCVELERPLNALH